MSNKVEVNAVDRAIKLGWKSGQWLSSSAWKVTRQLVSIEKEAVRLRTQGGGIGFPFASVPWDTVVQETLPL